MSSLINAAGIFDPEFAFHVRHLCYKWILPPSRRPSYHSSKSKPSPSLGNLDLLGTPFSKCREKKSLVFGPLHQGTDEKSHMLLFLSSQFQCRPRKLPTPPSYKIRKHATGTPKHTAGTFRNAAGSPKTVLDIGEKL